MKEDPELLLSKYIKATCEILGAKLLLRADLDYSEEEFPFKELVCLLGDKLTKQNELK